MTYFGHLLTVTDVRCESLHAAGSNSFSGLPSPRPDALSKLVQKPNALLTGNIPTKITLSKPHSHRILCQRFLVGITLLNGTLLFFVGRRPAFLVKKYLFTALLSFSARDYSANNI